MVRGGIWEMMSDLYAMGGSHILSIICKIRANMLYDKAEPFDNLLLYYDCPSFDDN